MDENNLEIIITSGNWQMPGKAQRWNWQVRQKVPPKYLAKGVSSGAKQAAIDAAQAAKAKILARVAIDGSDGPSRGGGPRPSVEIVARGNRDVE